jgi:predicted enzyme involved in methoxymalonyl-ACP biosynthesis
VVAEIDTFLLSCRVLGRRVEDALLAFAAERSAARGARQLVGRYVPTAKNGQAESFFPDRGFEPAGDGSYRLDIGVRELTQPLGLRVEVPEHA